RGFAHMEHLTGVAVPAIFNNGYVDIKDVAFFKHFLFTRNAVANYVVDRSTDSFWKTLVTYVSWDRFLHINNVVVAELVKLFCGHTWLNMRGNHFQNFGGQTTSFAHGFNIFRGFDRNTHKCVFY